MSYAQSIKPALRMKSYLTQMKLANRQVSWTFDTELEAKRFRFALLNALNAARKFQLQDLADIGGTVKAAARTVTYTPAIRFAVRSSGIDTNVTNLAGLVQLFISNPPEHTIIEFPNIDYSKMDVDLLCEWLSMKKFTLITTLPFTLSTT